MSLALGWLFQALLLVGAVALVRATVRRWRRTDVRLALVGSTSALVARVSLHLLPWSMATFGAGVVVGVVGLDRLGATLISAAAMVAFCAACTLGLLLPNLADPLRVPADR